MRPLPMGIYTPLPCFFDDNEDIGEIDMAHMEYSVANAK